MDLRTCLSVFLSRSTSRKSRMMVERCGLSGNMSAIFWRERSASLPPSSISMSTINRADFSREPSRRFAMLSLAERKSCNFDRLKIHDAVVVFNLGNHDRPASAVGGADAGFEIIKTGVVPCIVACALLIDYVCCVNYFVLAHFKSLFSSVCRTRLISYISIVAGSATSTITQGYYS